MKKLLFFWNQLMATFWFVPVLLIISSVLLSIGLVSLDKSISIPKEEWVHIFLVNGPESARSILSTISGAMIGVAGTVFSVTLVALTLASSQYGPRLIKNFMYVRLNQVVLGSYVSTYLYCLLILNTIKAGDVYNFVPSISILVAILAAFANIILLIVFIHQIAVSIQADNVISDISDLIATQVKAFLPEKLEDESKDKQEFDKDESISGYKISTTIKSSKSGYLQYIDIDNLVGNTSENDALIKLNHRPGSFLVKGQEIGILYSNEPWEEEALDKVENQFITGRTKSSQQDLEYSIHQMVEIAARALSPGVNDPYTAIACIDNLTATLCFLTNVEFPSKYRVDDNAQLRVITHELDFEGVLDASFNQIRQFTGCSTSVLIRLMEALDTILKMSTKDNQKKAIIKHAQMVYRHGKNSIKEENDLQDLEKRAKTILN